MARYVKVLTSDQSTPKVAGVPAEWTDVEDLGLGGGSGVTNSAGANVLPKSDGTNLVASRITDDGVDITLGEYTIDTSGTYIEVDTEGLSVKIQGGADGGEISMLRGANSIGLAGTVQINSDDSIHATVATESLVIDGIGHTITMQAASGVTIVPPTADPHIAGALWNNAGTLAISAG